ncbi:MAG: hypothetical protein B7X03_01065 [Parcubacteria group bacterium 21-58-10]|nr:MAG: hypothetical protein B7X03_01065 [Parcubacteria group bacterium 21-58-10]
MSFWTTILGLLVVGFFLYGFKHDGIIERLEHKKLKDLTVNDFFDILLGILLVGAFIKLLFG